MTKDEVLKELLAERYGKPVREYKPQPISVGDLAALLDELDDKKAPVSRHKPRPKTTMTAPADLGPVRRMTA
jgi:hypothetical protein